MSKNSSIEAIQNAMDGLTKKWWFYLLLLSPIFIRPYASQPYDPRQTMDVIIQALSKPLVYRFPILFPIFKAVPVILIIGLFVFGNRMRRAFNLYAGILFLTLAIFQNAGQNEAYGLVVCTGNLILVLIVGLVWLWEVFAGQNDFELRKQPFWRWWPTPLAAFALLAPIDAITLAPDFRLIRLLTSESGLTSCMIIAVILFVLTLYFPTINLALLRIMSFVGIYFGIINVVIWFAVYPSGWWMGVLHIPLLTISVYAFVLGYKRTQ
jgi:hypothetical protein